LRLVENTHKISKKGIFFKKMLKKEELKIKKKKQMKNQNKVKLWFYSKILAILIISDQYNNESVMLGVVIGPEDVLVWYQER